MKSSTPSTPPDTRDVSSAYPASSPKEEKEEKEEEEQGGGGLVGWCETAIG